VKPVWSIHDLIKDVSAPSSTQFNIARIVQSAMLPASKATPAIENDVGRILGFAQYVHHATTDNVKPLLSLSEAMYASPCPLFVP
jgi:hypothetical protein